MDYDAIRSVYELDAEGGVSVTNILIGCPLVGDPYADRNWILDQWYQFSLTSSLQVPDVEISWCVTVHPEDEDTKLNLMGFPFMSAFESEFQGGKGDHRWNKERYYTMVNLRNELLGHVRDAAPDYFISLDSDVLLCPEAISLLLDAFDNDSDVWAVGIPFYVSRHGNKHPNNGRWIGSRRSMFQRYDFHHLAKMDILIGGYMMDPRAYNVDYEFSSRGEDLGWSDAITRAGGKLVWDGRMRNKHVMDRNMLNTVDSRVGY